MRMVKGAIIGATIAVISVLLLLSAVWIYDYWNTFTIN